MVKQDLNLRVKIDKDQMFETYLEGSSYPFSRLYPYPEPSDEPTVYSSQELICGFNLANFGLL